MAPVSVSELADPIVREKLDEESYAKAVEELEMLDIAGVEYSPERVHEGTQTPVFFGSAMNNFGVQMLLDSFPGSLDRAGRAQRGGPRVRLSRRTRSSAVSSSRSRRTWIRGTAIASRFCGCAPVKFDRDMQVTHSRTGKKVRLSNAHRLFAKERETMEEAWPGDIVGLVGYNDFGIGDTLAEDPRVRYDEIPRFAPECFAFLHNPNTGKFKQFRQGLEQLLQEGVVQLFQFPDAVQKIPLLAAVGPLQFEVVQYRLQSEYGAESRLENAPWECAKWLPDRDRREVAAPADGRAPGGGFKRPAGAALSEHMDAAVLQGD